MATISQALSLQDGVSPALVKMAASVDKVIARFNRLTGASTQMEAKVTEAGSRGAAAMKMTEREIEQTKAMIERLNASTQRAKTAFGEMGKIGQGAFSGIRASVSSLIAPFAGLMAIGQVASLMGKAREQASAYGGAMTRLNTIMGARMNADKAMVNSILSVIDAQEQLGVINKTAQISGTQQLASYMNNADALATLIPAMNNLAAQSKGAAASSEDMVNIANMMGKAFQGQIGALTRVGITFNDVQENILKTGTEMEKAAVMAEIIEQNFGKMNEVMGGKESGQVAHKMFQLNAVLIEVGKSINSAINAFKISSLDIQIAAVQLLGKVITSVMGVMSRLAQLLGEAYHAAYPFFVQIGQFVEDNWGIFQGIILGIVGALIAYEAASTISTVVTWGMVAAKAAMAAADVYAAFATDGLTAAFWALDAAMAANPIGFVVACVIALIGLFYLLIGIINRVAGTSISATGIIVGAFMMAFAKIHNIFAVFYNLVVSVAEFMGNVFIDPLAAIQNLFYDIWSGIVDLVASAVGRILDMIGKIPGLDKIGIKVPSSDEVASNMKAMMPVQRKAVAGGYSFGRMERMNEVGAFENGYAMGEAFENKVSSIFDSPLPSANQTNTPTPDSTIDDTEAGGAMKDTAGNTGKMAKDMEILDEDLKYLRDAAEQEAINRYTTATVNVEMGGVTNNVASSVDVDGMMVQLSDSLTESMAIGAEKVQTV